MHVTLLSVTLSPHVLRGNFLHKGKFKTPVVYMASNKYKTMSKIIFNTLGNGVRDRTSRTPLPVWLVISRAR